MGLAEILHHAGNIFFQKVFQSHDVRAVVVVSDITSDIKPTGLILKARVETTEYWKV